MERDIALQLIREADARGIRTEELANQMNLDARAEHRLRRTIEELLSEGAIEKVDGGRYRLPRAKGEEDGDGRPEDVPAGGVQPGVTGHIRVHPAGYGFVERDDGQDDVFVAARHRGAAMDGDHVEILVWAGYKGPEGRVGRILERGRAKITGTLLVSGRKVTLAPDDPRIHGTVALDEGAGGARDGQAVVVEITRYPAAPGEPLCGRVIHVLGDPDDPRTEVAKVIICADIPDQFSDDAAMAAARAPSEVRESDLVDRVDLRDREFVTCDPETARDFDDAVCVEETAGGWQLWVAVADVSHYVGAGSALDREARSRGCSVYLPDRAIPMLPDQLSAGMCSLNPEVDRLAMVLKLSVLRDGSVSDPRLMAAVIRSRARLDYAGVAAALAGDFRGPRARYRDHVPHLARAAECARRLRKRREERGALDFNLEQALVVLDEDDPKRVRDVRKSRASDEIRATYGMIEDFMLAANEAVAAFFRERGLDSIWRVHDKPDEERIEVFAHLASSYGVGFSAADGADPRVLRKTIAQLAGHPAERALSYLLLRSLKQASYDVVNIGHFGLAARDYLHFTSPIRRYPDLIVHRLLKRQLHLEGVPSGGRHHAPAPARELLAQMAAEASAHERRAMEAEREVVDMYRAYVMRDRIGEEYDGVVTGVTSFGLFVQIDQPFVEGMIPVAALGGDFFEHDEIGMRLTGRKSGRAFALGDTVRVRIENVSVARRRIDLALVAAGGREAPAVEAGARPARKGRERGKRRAEGGRKKPSGGRRRRNGR